MTGRTLLAILCCLSFSGCDRLSEKDKMDMIAKCDSEARKGINEGSSQQGGTSYVVKVTSHYSFEENKCYGLKKTVETVFNPETFKFVLREETVSLYDGLGKTDMLSASCAMNFRGVGKGESACFGGGIAYGPLAGDKKKLRSFKEGMVIIEERMNRP